jgi:hypothetical protein
MDIEDKATRILCYAIFQEVLGRLEGNYRNPWDSIKTLNELFIDSSSSTTNTLKSATVIMSLPPSTGG